MKSFSMVWPLSIFNIAHCIGKIIPFLDQKGNEIAKVKITQIASHTDHRYSVVNVELVEGDLSSYVPCLTGLDIKDHLIDVSFTKEDE